MEKNENIKVNHWDGETISTGKRYAMVFPPLKNRSIISGYKGNYEWWNMHNHTNEDESFFEDDEGVKLYLKTQQQTDELPNDDNSNY